MTLAKATVTGTVFRAPEKRYTQNDIAIYGLTLNIDEREETLIRVISKRKSLSDVLDRVKVGDKILVDGRLQIATTKANDGSDRKYFEIDANDVELLGASNGSVPVSSSASRVLLRLHQKKISLLLLKQIFRKILLWMRTKFRSKSNRKHYCFKKV